MDRVLYVTSSPAVSRNWNARFMQVRFNDFVLMTPVVVVRDESQLLDNVSPFSVVFA